MIIQPKPAGTHGWVNGGHNRFITDHYLCHHSSSAPLCGAFDLSNVVYTGWAILAAGFFDITRILLQQPDLAALSETLTGLVQQSALADRAAIILWHSGNHRVSGTPATTRDSR